MRQVADSMEKERKTKDKIANDKEQKLTNIENNSTAPIAETIIWEIFDDNTIFIKNCKQFIKYGSMEVSEDVAAFFEVEGLEMGERTTISIICGEKILSCFAIRNSINGRVQLFWESEIVGIVHDYIRISRRKKIELKFTRTGHLQYLMEFESRAARAGRKGGRKKKAAVEATEPEKLESESVLPVNTQKFVQGSRGDKKPEFGVFESWETVDENQACRICDPSFLKNGVDVIPAEVRWFFYASNLAGGEKVELDLSYENKKYGAFIVMDSAEDETRLFLTSDLARQLLRDLPLSLNRIKGNLEFFRTGEQQYRLTLSK